MSMPRQLQATHFRRQDQVAGLRLALRCKLEVLRNQEGCWKNLNAKQL